MNFIIPYYKDERMIYTQKYLVNQGYHEVFDKSKADFGQANLYIATILFY